MAKKILVIGNTISAYSLAKALSGKYEVFAAPGSDTVKEFAQCVDIRETSAPELLEFAVENAIDLTIPVSESSIKTEITDLFTKNRLQIFSPALNAAKPIFDKASAKRIFYKLKIPTPKFGIFEKQVMAKEYLKNQNTPFVIKTNEPSSAVIITSQNTSKKILDSCFAKPQKVIIEDYVYGSAFSFYAITDGYKALPLGTSLTYRHSLEGEGGQLTCGMGACVPNYKLSVENEGFIMNGVVYPLLDYLENSGNPYTGILGINGILADDGRIQVLGFQPFMSDADCEGILQSLDTDLYTLFESCIIGSFSDEVEFVPQKDISSVSLTLVCKNREDKENVIYGLETLDDTVSTAFSPKVRRNRYLELEAPQGEVMVITAQGRTLSSAVKKVYDEVSDIEFRGLSYRKDIAKPLTLSV